MRYLIGVVVGVAGVAASAYVGVVVFFIGGIEQIVDGVNAHPADGSKIAWGIVKIVAYDSIAGLGIILAIVLAVLIATGSPPRRFRRNRRSANRLPRY